MDAATKNNLSPNDSFHSFNVDDYTKVHEILKNIQFALKTPQIDVHSLIK